MTAEQFLYWLQGYFEMNGTDKPLTLEQTKMVANHLNLVFKHMVGAPVHHEDTMTDEQKQKAGEGIPQTMEELLRLIRKKAPAQHVHHRFDLPTLIC